MPIADGQFSSPSSVVGDDVEKVQKQTSSRHELKLSDSASVTRSTSCTRAAVAYGVAREVPDMGAHLVGRFRGQQT